MRNQCVAKILFFWLNPPSPISRQLLLKNNFSCQTCHILEVTLELIIFSVESVKGGFVFLNFNGSRMQLTLAGGNSVWVYNPNKTLYVCVRERDIVHWNILMSWQTSDKQWMHYHSENEHLPSFAFPVCCFFSLPHHSPPSSYTILRTEDKLK